MLWVIHFSKNIYIHVNHVSVKGNEMLYINKGFFHLPFLELSIINLKDIKMTINSWTATASIEPGQTAVDVQAGLALYWCQRLITFISCSVGV